MDLVQSVRVCKLHVVIHVIKYEDRDWLFDFSLWRDWLFDFSLIWSDWLFDFLNIYREC